MELRIHVNILTEAEKQKNEGKEEKKPSHKERVLEEWEKDRIVIESCTYNTVEVTVNVKVLVKVSTE